MYGPPKKAFLLFLGAICISFLLGWLGYYHSPLPIDLDSFWFLWQVPLMQLLLLLLFDQVCGGLLWLTCHSLRCEKCAIRVLALVMVSKPHTLSPLHCWEPNAAGEGGKWSMQIDTTLSVNVWASRIFFWLRKRREREGERENMIADTAADAQSCG